MKANRRQFAAYSQTSVQPACGAGLREVPWQLRQLM